MENKSLSKKQRGMNMSSNNQQSGSGTFVDPFIDLFIMIINGLISLIIFLITKSVELLVKKLSPSQQEVITANHLKFPKTTTSSEDLGISCLTKKQLKLVDLNTHLHTLIIGSSGWGKSNTLNLLFENSIAKDLPITYIDPKGNREAIEDFASLCHFYKKDCFIFSELSTSPIKFDFFYGLKNDEIVTSILRSIEWSEEYYRAKSQSFLFEAVEYLRDNNKSITLSHIFEYLMQEHKNNKNLEGLKSNLEMVTKSSFAKLINFTKADEKAGLVTSLPQIKDKRSCMYVGLSTQAKGDIARMFGKLFVNSAMMISHYAGINHRKSSEAIKNGMSFVLDEAGSMVYRDFIELLNKCRSSGIQIYACVQSLADFDAISPEFKKQCFENFATTIVFKQGEPENAQYLAESIGTVDSVKHTRMQENESDTGKGSVRESKEFICHPDILRMIPVGKAVVVRRNPYTVDLVNVRYVSDSEAFRNCPELKISKIKNETNLVEKVSIKPLFVIEVSSK